MKLINLARLVVLTIPAFGLFAATASLAQAEAKIGYVDLQRALNETEDGRRAKAQLKTIFDRKQKELDERSTALKAKIEDLNKKRTLLPEETRLKKEGELSEEMKEVQETYMRHQKDLGEQEQKATGVILERMQRIISEIAVSEDLAIVLDKNQAGIIFGRTEFDLTSQLVRRYNALKPDQKGSAPAGSGPKVPTAPKKK